MYVWWFVFEYRLVFVQSNATQKEYDQTLDGILLMLWCTHTVHIMNCKSNMKQESEDI